MKPTDEIANKVRTTCTQEFSFTETQHLNDLQLSEEELGAVVVVSNIMFLRVKQLPQVINNEGKRAAAKAFRLYHQVAKTFAEQTNACFYIYDPSSFLLIYPGPREASRQTVKLAMQLTHILTQSLKDFPEHFNNTDFSIGITHGRVLGTNEGRMIWQGICIEKAKAISELCARPLRIGISGMIHSMLEESDKVCVQRILGIPKKEEIWMRYSYNFVGEHKHYYVTRHTEEYQPKNSVD